MLFRSVVQYPEPHRVLPFVTSFDMNNMDFTSDNMDACVSMVSFFCKFCKKRRMKNLYLLYFSKIC